MVAYSMGDSKMRVGGAWVGTGGGPIVVTSLCSSSHAHSGPLVKCCGKEKQTEMILFVAYKFPELHVELCDVLGLRTMRHDHVDRDSSCY